MHGERALRVLYDLAVTIGSEVSLDALLRRTLQRLLFHTDFPCGLVLLRPEGTEYATDNYSMVMAVGDALAQEQQGTTVTLPSSVVDGLDAPGGIDALLAVLPCRQNKYAKVVCLRVAQQGFVILMSPGGPIDAVRLEYVFEPMMANLAKAIHLCRVNDQQKALLESAVASRTAELHASEERVRLLLESTAEAIYGTDTEGRCTFANASCVRLLGYEQADEMLGRDMHAELHSGPEGTVFCAGEQCLIARAIHGAQRTHIESERLCRRNGEVFPVEYRSFPIIKNGERLGTVGSFVDISARVATALEDQEMQKRLEHTQRLESLGVLAGGIAHDFNNLLTAIMGNAALAKLNLNDVAPARGHIDQIAEASQVAADLCKQMLAYSGRGKFIVRPINISELVRQMAKLLEVSISKNVQVTYALGSNLPAIDADIAQLQQVLMNLITNANEACEGQKGSIEVITTCEQFSAEELSLVHGQPSHGAGKYIVVRISDSGSGMDSATQERIFEPFYTTKFTGRGLGMSAVLGILRGHRGAIRIESRSGRGTVVEVMFPASTSQARPLYAAQSKGEQPRGVGTVLVVDDEKAVREFAKTVLTDAGFEVLEAGNGVEAVDVFNNHSSDIVAVLLDMTMPRMNGDAAFRELRRINDEVKVVLTSGYEKEDATQKFAGRGLAGFLQKPFLPRELLTAIHAVIPDD